MGQPQEEQPVSKQMLLDSIEMGRLTRQQWMLEARQGTRKLDFVQLRQLDEAVKTCQSLLKTTPA